MDLKMNRIVVLEISCVIIALHLMDFAGALHKETPEPEALLQPRNYNPHPYTEGQGRPRFVTNSPNNYYNPGPVQFPPNSNKIEGLPHPYEKVSTKSRQYVGRKYSDRDLEQFQPAYAALSKHATKVLNNKLTRRLAADKIQDEEDISPSKKHYAFSYTVRDRDSGDDFSHTQQQKDGAVHGNYQVQLPDGRLQIVKYTADNNGYRADVTYNNEHNELESPVQSEPQHYPRRIHYHQILDEPSLIEIPPPPPSETTAPTYSHKNPALISAQPVYDYYKNLQYLQGTQNYDSQSYNGYSSAHPTASPTPQRFSSQYPTSPTPYSHHQTINIPKVNVNDHNPIPSRNDAESHIFVSTTSAPYPSSPTPASYSSQPHPSSASYSSHPHPSHHPSYSSQHKPAPALIAKLVVPSTPAPSYEDITVIPISNYHESPTYDEYGPLSNNLLSGEYINPNHHNSNHHHVSETPADYHSHHFTEISPSSATHLRITSPPLY